jgi:hypothetical protein
VASQDDALATVASLPAEERMANAAEAQTAFGWLTIAGLVATVVFTCLTWLETRRMRVADTTPFLAIHPVRAKSIRWPAPGEPRQILFKIRNLGRGPAFVTAIYRSWQVRGKRHDPKPIKRGDAEWSASFYKKMWMPIAPGALSTELDCRNTRGAFAGLTAPANGSYYFVGYIEFEDVRGDKYVAGFCHIIRLDDEAKDRGMHIALPSQDAEKYNYQRKLSA